MTSEEKIKWDDGKEYPVIKVEVSSASHPFYTGKKLFVDTAGRVERFNQKYKAKQVTAKPSLKEEAPADEDVKQVETLAAEQVKEIAVAEAPSTEEVKEETTTAEASATEEVKEEAPAAEEAKKEAPAAEEAKEKAPAAEEAKEETPSAEEDKSNSEDAPEESGSEEKKEN